MAISITAYSNCLAPVIAHIGLDHFFEQLMACLKKLLPIDNGVILYYPRQQPPRLNHNDLPPANRPTHIDLFLKSAYLLDPCYRAAQQGRYGYYRLDELAPEGFRNSEYYKNYFRHTGLVDECGYLFQLDGELLNISLARNEHHRRFGRHQQRLLQDIEPVVEALCRQHWLRTAPEQRREHHLHHSLATALDYFGTSILTERETQVIQLCLHGHSTKSIARKLSISPETVKLHRKHSYAKLDISSQAELFHLFIDALSSMTSTQQGDPLQGYLDKNSADVQR